MEHVVSDLLLERIDRYLGHPTEDPHGDPIPSAAGELKYGQLKTLMECQLQMHVTVTVSATKIRNSLTMSQSQVNSG